MVTSRSLAELDGEPHANVFPESEPKTIRLRLSEGESVPAHDHPDREIVFLVREGAISVELGEDTHEVTDGEVVRFDGDQQISPTALTDSEALIVLAKKRS